MKNITTYLETIGDIGFTEEPFSPVDSLVLSQLSYIRFDTLYPATLSKLIGSPDHLFEINVTQLSLIKDSSCLYDALPRRAPFQRFLTALCNCPRYRDLTIRYLVSETDSVSEKQFSAMCCFPGDGTVHVTYRGTDVTIVGWKEDFNMAFISPVPAQAESCLYLDTVASLTALPLRVGGHSKGGNLAVYASVKCNLAVQDRIIDVYSHDGPGFRNEVFELPEFQRILGRIHKYIPQSSIVGMILEHQENGVVIESHQIGMLQHDPFSWVVEHDDFVYISSIENSAMLMDTSLNNWINEMTDPQRELFVDTLFRIINAAGATTVMELIKNPKSLYAIFDAMRGIDKDTREELMKLTGRLFSLIAASFHENRLEHLANLNPLHREIEEKE